MDTVAESTAVATAEAPAPSAPEYSEKPAEPAGNYKDVSAAKRSYAYEFLLLPYQLSPLFIHG